MALWAQLRSPRAALLLVATAVCLIRARDQPSVNVHVGAATASIVPADVLLAFLAIVVVIELAKRGLPRRLWFGAASAAVFCLLVLGTAAADGSTALVTGVKLTELAVLGLAIALFVRAPDQLESVVDVLILFTIAADIVGVVKFVDGGGGRQPAFLGEHDFAALATMPLLYGLVLLANASTRRAWIAVVAGSIGCILGAALASLLGLYLGAAVLIIATALRRRLTVRYVAIVVVVVGIVTGGTLMLRANSLGFLQSWFGKPPSRPGQYASSWSQRLIYTYIGGRIFLAHPILGTGWLGDLPPNRFVAYLPAARRHYSDQPARYFPPADKPFIPQQTFDQVLYELGLVGGAAMLALFIALGRASVSAARRAGDVLAMLPATWLAAIIGGLAGEGLFGGTPLAALFWIVAGVILALGMRPRTDT